MCIIMFLILFYKCTSRLSDNHYGADGDNKLEIISQFYQYLWISGGDDSYRRCYLLLLEYLKHLQQIY